jgi:periplasmic protein TonB
VLVVGLTMSSTTVAGSFAAPVGHTLYGKTETTAADPAEVKPYGAAKYAPVYQLDTEPSVLAEFKAPYPDAARRAGIEGTVLLSLTIDDKGNVVAAKVLNGPGYGLEDAAHKAIFKYRFRPAMKDGEQVATEIKYRYTFVLD